MHSSKYVQIIRIKHFRQAAMSALETEWCKAYVMFCKYAMGLYDSTSCTYWSVSLYQITGKEWWHNTTAWFYSNQTSAPLKKGGGGGFFFFQVPTPTKATVCTSLLCQRASVIITGSYQGSNMSKIKTLSDASEMKNKLCKYPAWQDKNIIIIDGVPYHKLSIFCGILLFVTKD